MKSEKTELQTAIHQQVVAAREGKDPRVAARLTSGWVLFGERQFVRGYVLLLPDPVVPTLNALGAQERTQFLLDMARLGDALLKVTNALRINYAILGNLEPALHAHVIPRYADEPEELRTAHPWAHDWQAAPLFDRIRELERVAAS
jgi:diadenosine tetraphosphate (Ap4A) HIT family hydrolase